MYIVKFLRCDPPACLRTRTERPAASAAHSCPASAPPPGPAERCGGAWSSLSASGRGGSIVLQRDPCGGFSQGISQSWDAATTLFAKPAEYFSLCLAKVPQF